jgi:hypothetical protein
MQNRGSNRILFRNLQKETYTEIVFTDFSICSKGLGSTSKQPSLESSQ